MVTLPPSPDPIPHRNRKLAESFGSDADRYDRARPRYPRELATIVLNGLPGSRVIDVGIGTGLSALPFRESGASVFGIEPDSRMAEVARSRGFDVAVSKFEDWNPAGRTFDAVIAGQTWHWIDPAEGAAKAATLLAPTGRLAAFWNIGDPDPDVASAFAEVYRALDTGLPFTPWARPALESYERILATSEDGIRGSHAFSEPARVRIDWRATVSRSHWLDQVPTHGGHNRIPAERLAQLLDRLGRVVDDHGRSFVMNYATVAVIADRS
jgi:SAM-dependent methyltransferase